MTKPVLAASAEKYCKHGAFGLIETIAQDFGLCIKIYAKEYNAGIEGAYRDLVEELQDLANHPVLSLFHPNDVLGTVGLDIANKELKHRPKLTERIYNMPAETQTEILFDGNRRTKSIGCTVRPIIAYKIKKLSKKKNISKSQLVSDVLEDYFEREEVDIWEK